MSYRDRRPTATDTVFQPEAPVAPVACPFCGSLDILTQYRRNAHDRLTAFAFCRCGATGPEAAIDYLRQAQSFAMVRWNRRG